MLFAYSKMNFSSFAYSKIVPSSSRRPVAARATRLPRRRAPRKIKGEASIIIIDKWTKEDNETATATG